MEQHPWQALVPTQVLQEQPTMEEGVSDVRYYFGRMANKVLCKLHSVRQSVSFLVLLVGCIYRNFTQN